MDYRRTTILGLAAALLLAAAPATPKSTPLPKDACSAAKSKWAHAQCENFHHSAPGDEYFGRMKLSYLGINNTFRDAAISAGAYTTASSIITKLSFADDAMNQWSSRFPGDPELARTYFLAIQAYRKVYTQPMQEKTWHYIQLLITRFPTSYFGKIEKAAIARGFTEHWFALAQICPTPIPTGVPLPETTPSATATPSAAPGQPNIDIITPPCVQPSPEPTLQPTSPVESPGAAALPLPSPSPTP